MFHRIPIDPALQPFIHDIRVQAFDSPALTRSSYMVLPGPFPVLGIRISGRLCVVGGSGRAEIQALTTSGITGLQDEPRWYVPEANTSSILVAFRPEGAFALFGLAMNELTNGELALDHLLPASIVRIAEERVAAASCHREAGAAVSSFLRVAVARPRASVHPLVAASLAAIRTRWGNVRIEQLARDASISRRQLERLFQEQVGLSPKRFAALTRFAHATAGLRRGICMSQLALNAGYADQAHFVRAVTRLSGHPPTRLLAAADRGVVSHLFNT